MFNSELYNFNSFVSGSSTYGYGLNKVGLNSSTKDSTADVSAAVPVSSSGSATQLGSGIQPGEDWAYGSDLSCN